MKKTLLAIALAVATLPVMSFARTQATPPASTAGSKATTKTKTKKHVRKVKHSKKNAKTATAAKK